MIETAPGASTPVTPLALLLASTARPLELVDYRGALTARELDAPEVETADLMESAAVHDLGWLKRVAVRGEDRLRWLSGMVTNTVSDLAEHAGALKDLAARQAIEHGIEKGRGGVYLMLTPEQYAKLKTKA